jgi:hypothetical protein
MTREAWLGWVLAVGVLALLLWWSACSWMRVAA